MLCAFGHAPVNAQCKKLSTSPVFLFSSSGFSCFYVKYTTHFYWNNQTSCCVCLFEGWSHLELLVQPQTHVTSCCKSSKVSYLPAISFKHWFESMTLIPIYCLMFPSDKTGPIVDWIPTWHPPFIISWFYDFPQLNDLSFDRELPQQVWPRIQRCQIFDEQMGYLNGSRNIHLISNNTET